MAEGGFPRVVDTINQDNPLPSFGDMHLSDHSNPVNQAPVLDKDTTSTLAYMDETYTPVTRDGLLKKKLVRPGNGTELFDGSFMKVHYQVFAFDADGKRKAEPFDSTWNRPDLEDDRYPNRTVAIPIEYRLMRGTVIGALDLGVATMEVGETAYFLARGIFAYGYFGLPGIVGSNAPVFLQVEVLQGLEPSPFQKILHGLLVNKNDLSLDDLYAAGMEFKKRGNTEYFHRRWDDALSNYKHAVTWIEGNNAMFPTDVQRFTRIHYALLNNIAACYLKLGRFESVVKYCLSALEVPEDLQGQNLGKLYYRLGLAQFELKQYDKSTESILKANGYAPFDPDVLSLLAKLQEMSVNQEKEKDAMWMRIGTGLLK